MVIRIAVLAGLLSLALMASAPKEQSTPKALTTYKQVKPILDKYCVPCHSKQAATNGLDLSTYKTAMKGGKRGKCIVPKDPKKSLLVKYVKGTLQPQMPMAMKPLTTKDQQKLEAWVKDGAKEK